MELLYEFFRLFVLTLAVSFWPFLFLLMVVIAGTWSLGEYTSLGESVKSKNDKRKKIHNSVDDIPINVDLTEYNDNPVIETSFGSERIGEVFTDGT